MTRPLTDLQTARALSGEIRPVTLVALTTFSDRTSETVSSQWLYTPAGRQAGASLTGHVTVGALEAITPVAEYMPHLPDNRDTSQIRRALRVTLSNADRSGWTFTSTGQFRSWLRVGDELSEFNVLNARVVVYLALADEATGALPDSSEWLVLYRGRVTRFGPITQESVDLECAYEDPDDGWVLATYPGPFESDVGRRLPRPYGTLSQIRVPSIEGISEANVSTVAYHQGGAGSWLFIPLGDGAKFNEFDNITLLWSTQTGGRGDIARHFDFIETIYYDQPFPPQSGIPGNGDAFELSDGISGYAIQGTPIDKYELPIRFALSDTEPIQGLDTLYRREENGELVPYPFDPADVGTHTYQGNTITVFNIPTNQKLEDFLTLASGRTGTVALFADLRGFVDGPTLLEHPADIIKHHLEASGQTVETTSYNNARTQLGASAKASLDVRGIALPWAEATVGLGYYARANVVPRQTSTGTEWLILVANGGTYDWPNTSREITQWQNFAELGADIDDQWATRFVFQYRFNAAAPTGGDGDYTRTLFANPNFSQLTKPTAADLAAAEEKYGQRSISLPIQGISDDATANDWAGYYAYELSRAPRLFALEGVPWWQSFDLELGDLVRVRPPWRSGTPPENPKCRVVEYTKDMSAMTAELRLLEVP